MQVSERKCVKVGTQESPEKHSQEQYDRSQTSWLSGNCVRRHIPVLCCVLPVHCAQEHCPCLHWSSQSDDACLSTDEYRYMNISQTVTNIRWPCIGLAKSYSDCWCIIVM